MQVGATTDQGLYNKPSAAVHPGALATGTLPQYNTSHYITTFHMTSCSISPLSLKTKQRRKCNTYIFQMHSCIFRIDLGFPFLAIALTVQLSPTTTLKALLVFR